MICTNCHYKGDSERITQGTMYTEVLLWLFLFWLWPVPLGYSIWRMASRYQGCPKCRKNSMIPTDTPRGKELNKNKK